MSANDLPARLRQARSDLHISRAELARRAGVSAETIKAYELGSRRPSRDLLIALLDTLRVERGARDEILVLAGFAPHEDGPERFPHFLFTPDEAREHCAGTAWPAFVLNELMEVVCYNRLIELVWDVDIARQYPRSVDRNLMRFASDPHIADRMGNWDELIRVAIAVFKGHHRGGETLEDPSPYFGRVLDDFLKGDSRYVTRMLQAWSETAPIEPKIRWTYPVVWETQGLPRMRFTAVVNPCNPERGLAFNDWMPLDAETWACLEELRLHDEA
jgi:transcriptional regulator with XRE-family HTH domain